MDWVGLQNEAARMLLEKDALHIYAGLMIQLTAAKLSHRSLGHVLPWLSVLGLELINEFIDILRGGEPRLMAWQVVSGVHDIINTMILPTVLLLLCRRAPELFIWRNRDAGPEAQRGAESRQDDQAADDPPVVESGHSRRMSEMSQLSS